MTPPQLELYDLKQGTIAGVLSVFPGIFDELTKIDGMVMTVVRNELNPPVSDYEYLLKVSTPRQEVFNIAEVFLDELCENHSVRIFRHININNFFIVTNLNWDEIVSLVKRSAERCGLTAD